VPDIFVNTFFEERVKNLFNLAERVEKAFSAARLEYRVVGGLAAYLYVEQVEPDAGRLTKDIDIVVRREDLEKIAKAAEAVGLQSACVRTRHAGPEGGALSTQSGPHDLHGRKASAGIS
jgi:hypothetical protein